MLKMLKKSTRCQRSIINAGHLIGCGKNGKLCGNFRQYYAEESDDYAEKTTDYAEISKNNIVVPLAKYTLTSYQEFNSFVTCLTFRYPGCQRSSRSPAARNVRISSADRRETSGSGS